MPKCSRAACHAEGDGFAHRDLGGDYCAKCARRINEANNLELLTRKVDPVCAVCGVDLPKYSSDTMCRRCRRVWNNRSRGCPIRRASL